MRKMPTPQDFNAIEICKLDVEELSSFWGLVRAKGLQNSYPREPVSPKLFDRLVVRFGKKDRRRKS